MIVLLFFILAWFTAAAIKQARRGKARKQIPQPPPQENPIERNVAAIQQLQAARATQAALIEYLSECITVSENPIETANLMAKKTAAQEKAARIEQKIIALTGG